MRKLITGSKGFLGRNLFSYYSEIFPEETFGAVREDLWRKLCDVRPEIIIHCAAEIYQETDMFTSNIKYLHNLLEYCRVLTPKLLILIGTSSEYGIQDDPMREDQELRPENMYAATKAAGCMLAQAYSNFFPILYVRPFTIVGRYQREHMFFPVIYRNYMSNQNRDGILKNIIPIKASIGVHDYVFIDDFLNALDYLISRTLSLISEEEYSFEIFNIGTGIQTSNWEILDIFQEILGFIFMRENVERMRRYDNLNWRADPKKLLDTGFRFKYNLYSGIKKFITDCRELNLYGLK